MGGCNSNCKEGMPKCNCHKNNKAHCDCSQGKCRCNQILVKDCVCVEWSVPHGETQTVFQTGGFREIFASGFVSFDCSGSDYIIARFFLGNQQVGEAIRIFEESSVAFSFTRFDRITVECPAICEDLSVFCEGDVCITTRFPVS